MKGNKAVLNTLINAQDDSKCKIEGFCGAGYASVPITCANAYCSSGTQSTCEELDILV